MAEGMAALQRLPSYGCDAKCPLTFAKESSIFSIATSRPSDHGGCLRLGAEICYSLQIKFSSHICCWLRARLAAKEAGVAGPHHVGAGRTHRIRSPMNISRQDQKNPRRTL